MNEKRIKILMAGMNDCGISSLIADTYYDSSSANALRELHKEGYIVPHPTKVQYWNTTEKGREAVRKATGIDSKNLCVGEYDPSSLLMYI